LFLFVLEGESVFFIVFVFGFSQVHAWTSKGVSPLSKKCTQHPGDVFFVPNLWEHGVDYLGPSVGAAYLYSGGNLPV
jgi:hypothetical protein